MRRVAAIAAVVALLWGCAETMPLSPVELAERHVHYYNAGDLEGFLAALAEDTLIGEIGTATDPDVIEAAAFQLGGVQGADGYVATCAPWGSDGAKCEGFVYDRVFSPAGLTHHLTLAYQFNAEGEITRLGEMDVYDQVEFGQFSSELAAWVASNHSDLAPVVTNYGRIVKNRGGAEAIEMLILLAEEFISQSDDWPIAANS